MPDGEYTVELRFAEPYVRAAGQRVFDVTVNGVVTIPGLDLATLGPPGQAVAITVSARAAAGGGLVVGFTPRRGETLLSGIRVRRR